MVEKHAMRRTTMRPFAWPSRLMVAAALALLVAGLAPFLPAQQASAQNVDITLTKTVCPEDFDAAGASLDDLIASCVAPGAEFPFSAVPEAGDPVEMSADASGIVSWTGLPAGAGFVSEVAGENNTSRVFCGVYPTGGEGPESYTEYGATNNTIDYSLNDNESLDCLWFNIFLEQPADGDSTVTVQKLACAEGYDYEAATGLDELIDNCVGPLEGVEFTLVPSDAAERAAATDASGVAGFDAVPGGAMTLAEAPPQGYQVARVFCDSGTIAEGGDGVYSEMTLEDNTVSFDLGAASFLDCYWFNAPAIPEESVNLVSLGCPQEYDWSQAGFETLVEDCTAPLEGIDFTLDDIVEPKEGATDEEAFLSFAAGPGDYALTQEQPEDYNETRVYCTLYEITEGRGEYTEYDLEDGTIQFSLETGESINCRWFNRFVSGDPGPASLTIDKYTCPAEFDVFAADADPASACTLPTGGVTFGLGGAATQLSASTGTGGAPATVAFEQLEAGTYFLSETMDDSIAFAFVLECASDARTFDYPFSPFAVIEPEGRLVVELLAGEDLACDWYNVLAPEPGTVTIAKTWCDGTSAADLANCEPYGGGITFSLEPIEGGDSVTLTTGADGTATVEVPAGAYEITEQGFEWCAAESDAVDAEGNIVVVAGEDVTIDIANCGPMPLQ
jgi:hypothetical protein